MQISSELIKIPLCTALSVAAFVSLIPVTIHAQNQSPARLEDAVVFVPGLYGSALRESSESKKLRWLSIGDVLFGRSALTRCEKNLFKPCIELVSDGALERIEVVPGLFSKDVYGATIEKLEQLIRQRAELKVFHYDWRQDVSESSRTFALWLKELSSRYRIRAMIGHSMGGLVLSGFLRCGESESTNCSKSKPNFPKISVVLAGVPFGGSVLSVYNVFKGRSLALNQKILTATAYSSFPSIHYLLPQGIDRIVDRDGRSQKLDLLEPSNWIDGKWGVISLADSSATSEDRANFLKRVLSNVRRFRSNLEELPDTAPGEPVFKALVIQGTGHITQNAAAIVHSTQYQDQYLECKDLESKNVVDLPACETDGDETVSLADSAVPKGLSRLLSPTLLQTTTPHSEMLTDSGVLRAIGCTIFNENCLLK
jgi:hypothetical protein